jgi:hypothetical protein
MDIWRLHNASAPRRPAHGPNRFRQHRKFFTTDPSERVARSLAFTGKIGHAHDRAVADLIAETIIDHFDRASRYRRPLSFLMIDILRAKIEHQVIDGANPRKSMKW